MMTAHSIVRFATAAAVLVAVGCSDNSTTIEPSAAALAARTGNPGALPDQYILPGNAVFPEGVAYDQRSGNVFVSSTTDGTIFRGDVTSETLTPFLAGNTDGRTTAIGLAVDDRGRLYVAGGGTGLVFIYDGATGALLAKLATGASPTFINDIVIAPDGSGLRHRLAESIHLSHRQRRVWKLLTRAMAQFYGHGVRATARLQRQRHRSHAQRALSHRHSVEHWKALPNRCCDEGGTQIDVGGATFPNGDGILLQGSALYILQNAQGLLVELRLDVANATATLVGSTSDPSFAFPTSLDFARGRLLVVNSQFNRRGPGLTPTLPFTVSVVKHP
jgi:Cu-Zn family superoxide dismutase